MPLHWTRVTYGGLFDGEERSEPPSFAPGRRMSEAMFMLCVVVLAVAVCRSTDCLGPVVVVERCCE